MTTKEVAEICGVTDRTVRGNAQKAGVLLENGKTHDWTDEEVKRLQLVLMSNAENNNVNASEQVIESRKTVFQLGTLANIALTSGNIEAAEEFSKLLIAATTATAQAKELEAKNQLLLEQKEKAEKEKDYIIQCNKNFHNNLYTATQIANKLGITPNKVGKIANENGLKNDPIYGKLGKIQLNNGQWVNQFYYNDDALTVIESIIG